jgi:hypothetical protein
MHTIAFILLVAAFLLELGATFWNPNPPQRWNLIAGGLACFFLYLILGAAPGL